jgi:predicted small lipoprotein YifL
MTAQPARRLFESFALMALFGLAACGAADLSTGTLPIPPAPVTLPIEPLPETPASAAEAAYYAQTQQTLLSSGLLRTDGGGPDAPFDAQMLAENFLRIAFYDEYDPALDNLVQQESASRLSRWVQPVRVSVEFGRSVAPRRQAIERARIGSYLSRLSILTGHPIALAERRANFVVYFGSIDERRALGPRILEVLPQLSPVLVAGVTQMGHANFCLVYVNSNAAGAVKERAMAVIPSELPDLMSLMCLHEELAQGLGLGNDSRLARPSIFNDDNEFATLTTQDELMLKMLYSPEFRPGMSEQEARPIAESLASQLMGGET